MRKNLLIVLIAMKVLVPFYTYSAMLPKVCERTAPAQQTHLEKALFQAIVEGNVKDVVSNAQELRNFVDLNELRCIAKDSEKRMTYLQLAAVYPVPEIVKALIDCGASVNEAGDNKETPLISAARAGRTENIEILLDAGAHIGTGTPIRHKLGHSLMPESSSCSPFLMATMCGHYNTARALIRRGADVASMGSYFREGCLHVLVKRFVFESCGSCRYRSEDESTQAAILTEFILASGADDIIQRDWRGMTPLHMDDTDPKIMQILCKKAGPKIINARDRFGNTPLCTAITNQPENIALLLKNGAVVNERNDKGETSLHCAARFGNRSVMRMLLGADKSRLLPDS